MRRLLMMMLVIHGTTAGGFELTEVSARATSMGRSCVGIANDVWAMYDNPGGLCLVQLRQASFFYAPAQFGLTELARSAFAVAVPLPVGAMGLAARFYGFELYHELSWTLSYARTISGVSLGVAVNEHTVTILNYGSSGTIGLDLGAVVRLSDRVQWGIAAKNVNSPTIGSAAEPLPQTFCSGLAFFPLSTMTLTVEYAGETGFDPSVRAGCEYWIDGAVALRGGICGTPSEYTGGIGIRAGRFCIDYALFMHEELGLTHEGSILIQW